MKKFRNLGTCGKSVVVGRTARFFSMILMMLTLCVGNAWGIDWASYSSKPVSNGQYYLRSDDPTNSTGFFFNTPTNASSTSMYINGTSSSNAILFTVGTVTADGNNVSMTEISFQSGNTKYSLWPKVKSTGAAWLSRTTMVPYTATFAKDATYYPNTNDNCAYYLYGGHNSVTTTPNKDTVLMPVSRKVPSSNATYNYAQLSGSLSISSAGKKVPWLFITPAAYADATATNQYYWTANAYAYTDGVASTAGGTAVVAKKTYARPNRGDQRAADYVTSVSGQKGNDSAQPTITVYYKATLNPGYEFLGWFAAAEGGSALSTALEYNYEFTATSTDSNNKTTKNLYARFHELPSVAKVYAGGEGDPAEYKTLGAALAAAVNEDSVVLTGDISEGALTLANDIVFNFNGHSITGTTNNLITVTGNVTFIDSQTSPGGVTTTGATAVLVSAGSLTINDGKYAGATYAIQQTGGSVTIKSGGFSGGTQDINGTITLEGGYFVHNAGLNITDTYAVSPYIPLGMKYSSGYKYMVISKSSPNYPICTVLNKERVEVGDTYDFNILSSINFSTLEAAIAYTNNNTNGEDEYKDIMMREDYTLQAGNYTIPEAVTLVIPYGAEQLQACPQINRTGMETTPDHAYRKLTLADGVHIEVIGAIEAGGVQSVGGYGVPGENATAISRPGVSADGGTYGVLQMNEGSSITMNGSSKLYAWGFVQGAGTIDVRRGAEVREQFQVNDWKTIVPIYRMAQYSSVNYHLYVLPINQYFIQNVEVKTTYRPGSRLLAQVSAYVYGASVNFNDIGIIGVKYSAAAKQADPDLKDDVAIFLMDNEDDSEDTWVCKSYDVTHDQQLYEVNNSAYLGSLKMDVAFATPIDLTFFGLGYVDGLDVDSRNFALPLTNNFKIHLLKGKLEITQNTELLPGSEIEVNKKATLTINSGQTLYLYDADQWHKYVSGEVQSNLSKSPLLFDYASHIKYRHGGTPDNTVRDISSPEALGDAKLTVHGTVDVKGYLKTTTGDMRLEPVQSAITLIGASQYVTEVNILDPDPESLGGASITSTIADAGTIVFSHAAPAINTEIRTYDYKYGKTTYHIVDVSDYLWQVDEAAKGANDVHYIGDHVIPAMLKNDGDNNYTHTANTAAGKSFCFVDMDGDGNGEWTCLTDAGCFVYDQNNIYYIKPQAYVPISVGAPVAEADHTYRDHYANTNKIYIQIDDCQWWEVVETATPGIFHCEHPLNDTYFYWNGTKWAEKRYSITFKTYDGITLEFEDKNGVTQDHYELTYGTTPTWLGDVPQRTEDNSYTYTFAGWTPTPYPVNKDEVYTAKYTTTPRMYQIRFEDQAHNLIENRYLTWGETPTCASYTPSANEQWEPAIGIVAGDATYTLAPKKTNGFTIRFVNYDGTLLDELTGVGLNTSAEAILAAYEGGEPTKDAIEDEEYTFAGWSPAVVAATEDATYTATFNATTLTFEIRFYQEDGTKQIGETQNVSYGAMPNIPEYGKDSATTAKIYTLYWTVGGTPTIVGAATTARDYVAAFTETTRQYRVDWKDGDDNIIETKYVDYGATPVYSGIIPTKSMDLNYAYTFNGTWKLGDAEASATFVPVEGDQVYTAQFDPIQRTLEAENGETETISSPVTVQEIIIRNGGKVTATAPGATITTDVLVLEADKTGSGQLIASVVNATNAYFDLALNTDGRHWHAFGVPWVVNLTANPLIEVENGRTLNISRDYEIMYYDGAERAANGPSSACWKYLRHYDEPGQPIEELLPGRGYMIAFGRHVNVVRFVKKASAPIIYKGTVDVTANQIGAISNPMAYHTTMNAGVGVGQVHDGGEIGHDEYTEVTITNKRFVVGKTVYIDPQTTRSVVIAQADGGVSPVNAAPARRGVAADKQYLTLEDYYTIALTPDNGGRTAKVYVLPEEDKEDQYVAGHDLAKMGMSDRKAQIWVNRYDTKLGLNTTAPINDVAVFPINLYAPSAGEFTISLASQPDEEYTVYLTNGGRVIWNLSDAEYELALPAGVNNQYGLRLVNNAPQITTGIDEAVVDAKGETRKVLINNQVYIIRGNNVYSVDGQMVK